MPAFYIGETPDRRVIPAEELTPEVKDLIGKLEFVIKDPEPVIWVNPLLLAAGVVEAVSTTHERESY